MEFKRLGEVTLVEEAVDTANVLIEENGEIKRVPKTEVGGTGFPTAIIKDSEYDNVLAGVQTMIAAGPVLTYECINMTFEEAYEIMASGGILNTIGMFSAEGAVNLYGIPFFTGSAVFGVPCIVISFMIGSDTIAQLFWTADGLSTERPGGDK